MTNLAGHVEPPGKKKAILPEEEWPESTAFLLKSMRKKKEAAEGMGVADEIEHKNKLASDLNSVKLLVQKRF
jgi:hypothetical protein